MVTYLLISLAYFQAVVLADDGAGDAGSTDNNSTSLAPTVFVDETAAEVPDDPASSSSPTISPTILEVLDNCPDYCAGGDDSSVDCLQGDATFDDHLQAVPPGASSTFLGPTNVDGYYCDCEDGRTGADCSIEYENCPDGKHTCYHGGTCVPAEGGQVYHCDCTSAQFEGKLHAGKFCEFKAQQDCDASNSFCVNDGVCLQNSEVNQACSCGSDWTGAHCEYKKSEAPTCDLDCQNQGTCQIGIPPSGLDHEGGIYDLKYCLCRDGYDGEYCEIDTTSGGPDDVVENNNPPADVTACSLTCLNGGVCKKGLIDSSLLGLGPELSQFEPTKNDDLEHCECSEGWIGKHCEASVEVCGDNEHLCLHGSSCVLESTTGEASWTCNCDDILIRLYLLVAIVNIIIRQSVGSRVRTTSTLENQPFPFVSMMVHVSPSKTLVGRLSQLVNVQMNILVHIANS